MAKNKIPQKPVEVGSRVRKRGFVHEGVVDKISTESPGWVNVVWDQGRERERPRICHAKELEVV